MNRFWIIIVPIGLIIGLAVYFLVLNKPAGLSRSMQVREWLRDPAAHLDWKMDAAQECEGAVFLFPTDGLIGYLWDDAFKIGHRHQGIDIFGGYEPGITPVVAAYDGFLTRLVDWKSTVIVRVPDDPLQPGRQIWTYYTHMADPDGNSYIVPEFAPGTSERFIKAGTLLGYQGNYSGDPNNPVGVHLHFSIVLDNGNGSFRNELDIGNTLDPSPYFNLPLNAKTTEDRAIKCEKSTQTGPS